MIINWVAAKTQQFLPVHDAEPDELSVNFDFALSAEMLGLLHAQNDDCMDAGGTTPRMRELASRMEQQSRASQEAIADAGDQAANATTATRFTLDEHELALA
jgi:hypothetical protein